MPYSRRLCAWPVSDKHDVIEKNGSTRRIALPSTKKRPSWPQVTGTENFVKFELRADLKETETDMLYSNLTEFLAQLSATDAISIIFIVNSRMHECHCFSAACED